MKIDFLNAMEERGKEHAVDTLQSALHDIMLIYCRTTAHLLESMNLISVQKYVL